MLTDADEELEMPMPAVVWRETAGGVGMHASIAGGDETRVGAEEAADVPREKGALGVQSPGRARAGGEEETGAQGGRHEMDGGREGTGRRR
jgi:hypothetical protein